jgi:hypothetical protein
MVYQENIKILLLLLYSLKNLLKIKRLSSKDNLDHAFITSKKVMHRLTKVPN